jgi:hypothetical protein
MIPNRISGAVLYEDCPTRSGKSQRCNCGTCAICGVRKHTAIHGPVNGGGRGSRPFDHAFMPEGESGFGHNLEAKQAAMRRRQERTRRTERIKIWGEAGV